MLLTLSVLCFYELFHLFNYVITENQEYSRLETTRINDYNYIDGHRTRSGNAFITLFLLKEYYVVVRYAVLRYVQLEIQRALG